MSGVGNIGSNAQNDLECFVEMQNHYFAGPDRGRRSELKLRSILLVDSDGCIFTTLRREPR